MGMNVGSGGEDEVMMEINTTPLIDIMLVLLIMFIITLPVQTHSVKLDMPRDNKDQPPPEHDPVVVDLIVDFDGTIYWNGNASTEQQVRGYLALEGEKDLEDQAEIHLRPDRLAKYDTVAHILADAQRQGVKKIGFVGNEQYIE